MVGVEYLLKGFWGTVSKVFSLVLNATGQAAEVHAVDLGYSTPLMIGGVLGWH